MYVRPVVHVCTFSSSLLGWFNSILFAIKLKRTNVGAAAGVRGRATASEFNQYCWEGCEMKWAH